MWIEMGKHTQFDWQYVPADQFHGPYVECEIGTIADCYTMSLPAEASVLNRGPSVPVLFQPECAEANARLIAAAPDLLHALQCAMKVANLWCPQGQGSPEDSEEDAAMWGLRILFQDAIAKATGCGVKPSGAGCDNAISQEKD